MQIDELNKTVYQQQLKIERLEAICEALAGQVQSLAEAGRAMAKGLRTRGRRITDFQNRLT